MNRGVELTAIHKHPEDAWYMQMRRNREGQAAAAAGTTLDFDEDDLERPINQDDGPDADNEDDGGPAPVQTAPTSEAPAGVYSPVMVFENDIREFYARRHNEGRPGTRIVYRSGAPRLVRETYEEVKAKFAALGVAND